jgi:hypothetical protein
LIDLGIPTICIDQVVNAFGSDMIFNCEYFLFKFDALLENELVITEYVDVMGKCP